MSPLSRLSLSRHYCDSACCVTRAPQALCRLYRDLGAMALQRRLCMLRHRSTVRLTCRSGEPGWQLPRLQGRRAVVAVARERSPVHASVARRSARACAGAPIRRARAASSAAAARAARAPPLARGDAPPTPPLHPPGSVATAKRGVHAERGPDSGERAWGGRGRGLPVVELHRSHPIVDRPAFFPAPRPRRPPAGSPS